MIKTILIAIGLVELLIGGASLTAIQSDIQIIIALCAFGFGITHIGIAAILMALGKTGGKA